MPSRTILLTIHPEHALTIYEGTKRAELRKSFPADGISLVFLYETGGSGAITGAFLVRRAERLPIDDIVRLARPLGVPAERSRRYFEGRKLGWLIEVGTAIPLAQPVTIAELRSANHEITPPQVFSYLQHSEGTTQLLLARFRDALVARRLFRLRKLRSETETSAFNKLMLETLPASYSDIDAGFVGQVADEFQAQSTAFSTDRKRVLRLFCGPILVGFTVVTRKSYRALKTGPTILLPEFRGIGLGSVLRAALDRYARRIGYWKVFCTVPATRTEVVKYLADSGLEIQARLRRHLAQDRDEYVLAKHLGPAPRGAGGPLTRRGRRDVAWVGRITADDPALQPVSAYFSNWMRQWYFKPPPGFAGTLRAGVRAGLAFDAVERKGKELWAALSSRRRPRAAVVCTGKRSAMIKLNVASDSDDGAAVARVVRAVVHAHVETRRFYVTVPSSAVKTVAALVAAGFRPEGILPQMFQADVDHLCLGLLVGERAAPRIASAAPVAPSLFARGG